MNAPAPLPHWPRLLGKELAAGYCGVSVTGFLGLVKDGVYPRPLSFPRRRLLWDKEDLDKAIAELKGEVDGPKGWDI